MDNSVEETLLAREQQDRTLNLRRRIWTESKLMWTIAFPGMVARMTSFGLTVVTQLFIGHISELDLAAFALQQSIFLRFINGILVGMSSATETLCGQAFGAGQYHMMGIYLQRSWIVDGVTATILLPMFIFATPILELLGQEKDIAVAAGPMSLWFIPLLYYFVFAFTNQMYLQAQLRNLIVGRLSAASFALHVLLCWIFLFKLNWGVAGAMAAYNISAWSIVLGMFAYIFGGWCPNTWKGLSMAAFSDLWPVIKLSVSSGVMICLEIWYNSVLVLLAGYMKNATVAITAFSICLNINAWVFTMCLGFLGAACVRVSNELGRGDAEAAKFSIKVILTTSICVGLILWIVTLLFGRDISYLFTTSDEVADVVSDLSVLLAFSILLNGVQPVLTGVAIGSGLQGIVAIVNLGSYFMIGVPVGFVLGYVAALQVIGLWIGLLSGVVVQTLILSFLIWRTNWDDQVKRASERLNRWFLDPSKESNECSSSA